MTATLTLFRPSILDPAPGGTRPAGGPRPVAREHGDGLRGPVVRDSGAERPAALDRRSGGRSAPTEPAGVGRNDPQRPSTGGGMTLDDLVVEVWEGLSAHRTVSCPACGSAMKPRYGAGPAPVGGRCMDCATTIS
jgi:hypothetical protein